MAKPTTAYEPKPSETMLKPLRNCGETMPKPFSGPKRNHRNHPSIGDGFGFGVGFGFKNDLEETAA